MIKKQKPITTCRCPNCGYEKPRGDVPCYYQVCPKCEHQLSGP